HTGESVVAAIFDRLRDVAWIPCQDGSLRSPAEVRLLPGSVPSVAAAHDWLSLAELVQPEVESEPRSRSLLVSEFECQEIREDSALALLAPGPDADATAYYRFLVEWSHTAGYFFG